MIYDSLKHMEAYQGVHPGIYKGLELLRDTDFSKLEDARGGGGSRSQRKKKTLTRK